MVIKLEITQLEGIYIKALNEMERSNKLATKKKIQGFWAVTSLKVEKAFGGMGRKANTVAGMVGAARAAGAGYKFLLFPQCRGLV